MVNEWLIGQICRSYLVGLYAKALEDMYAGFVPGRAHINDVVLGNIFKNLSMLFDCQLEAPQEVNKIFRAKAALSVQCAASIYLIQMTHLEFNTISTSAAGLVNHIYGKIEVTIMVVADLGNDRPYPSNSMQLKKS